jgi:uncharacterized protein (TIGR03083 family)
MGADGRWSFLDPASKPNLLAALRHEMEGTFDLIDDPARWEAPTACEGWQVRDVVGHLVDTTEGYLPAFELARTGGEPIEPRSLRDMARLVDEGARQYRKVPREELVARLRDDADRMMAIFDELSPDDWAGLQVGHGFMGPVPAMFYAEFQLVDYAVHGWDIRQGIGEPHGLDGDSADLLVPLIFILWQATADTTAVGAPYSVGVRTSGRNGGDVRADVSSAGVQFGPGELDDCVAILEFDPATFVLTGYSRMNGGTVRGDAGVASSFRQLFFAI